MIKDRNIADDACISSTKIQGLQGVAPITGEVFYVAKSGLQARTWLQKRVPESKLFLTIDAAIGACTANRGDVIYVCPGHTETIAVAGGITADVAGISIIGLGNGNLRPVISFSATTSTFAISAANVTVKNIQVTNTIDEVVTLFHVTAAGCTIDAVDFYPTTGQARQFLLTTNAADQLTVKNCFHRQASAAGAAQVWIQLVGTDHSRILNNTIMITANASTSSICISGSTAVVDAEIVGNKINWLGGTITKIIECVTGSTGIVADNKCMGGSAVLLAGAITGDAMQFSQNYVTNTAGTASGALAPAVDVVT
jgi:hypothetical protein